MKCERYLTAALLCGLFLLVFSFAAFGQAGPGAPVQPGTAPISDPVNFATQVIKLGAFISSIIFALQKFAPTVIQGRVAVVLTFIGGIAVAYAGAPAGSVLTLQFLLTTLGAVASANGIHGFAKLIGVTAAGS